MTPASRSVSSRFPPTSRPYSPGFPPPCPPPLVSLANIFQLQTFLYTLYSCIRYTFKYYLKYDHECFIRYKTRGAAERFISDKARIASVYPDIVSIPILSLCLRKNFEYRCCISRENRGKSFVKIYVCFITYKDSFTAMIFFVFCS